MPRQEEEAQRGAPEWMVTYGDCMGLLLTFFIMLAAMSEVKEEKFHKVLESIREYLGYETADASEPGQATAGSLYEQIRRVAQESAPIDRPEGVDARSTLGQDVRVQTVEEGYKITVGGKILFDEGSAELKESAHDTLGRLAGVVSGYYNKLEIRGHTAIEDLPPGAKDLFDLAYMRAKAVGEYMVNQGIDRRRIRLQSGGPYDRPDSNLSYEGQEINRRVEIIVSDELIKPEGSGGE